MSIVKIRTNKIMAVRIDVAKWTKRPLLKEQQPRVFKYLIVGQLTTE